MTRTRFLVAALVVVILLRLFPDRSGIIERAGLVVVALCGVAWLGSRTFAQARARRERARLEAADAAEFRDYERELEALRARVEESSPEFQTAVSALLERHRDMLTRKFGSV